MIVSKRRDEANLYDPNFTSILYRRPVQQAKKIQKIFSIMNKITRQKTAALDNFLTYTT